MILALNMSDLSENKGIKIDATKLSTLLEVPVVNISAKNKAGLTELNTQINKSLNYGKEKIAANIQEEKSTLNRYEKIDAIVKQCSNTVKTNYNLYNDKKLDGFFLNSLWGGLVFIGILFCMFQAVFSWSEPLMELIETGFIQLGILCSGTLPNGWLNDLMVNGVIPGLGGVMIFIPQIALLFLFIALMEETGYMARVSIITDRIMSYFGLNGRSVIPLISGVACAIPGVMAARTISNWKERMITIMVTPLMTCAARLPVYVLLIGLVIPNRTIGGFIGLQGLTMIGLYFLGVIMALLVALILKFILKSEQKSYFVMELPPYRLPRTKNVLLTIIAKVKAFVFDAGKIIVIISVILWGLSSFGPGNSFEKIEEKYRQEEIQFNHTPDVLANKLAAEKLEASYAGVIGHWVEPVIRPLGYDWKIGIALITSFAAREVFVGTMATIYSLGDEEATEPIKEKMEREVHSDTGNKVYTLATGISLLLFYAFAMQCMSTVAVVYRETKHWKWPAIQLIYMSVLAYGSGFLAYQLLS